MIYRSGALGLALREAYTSGKVAARRKTAFGFFLGLLAFALFFMAQTMTESVFAETLPQLMQPSFFSTLYIYIHLASFAYTYYLLAYYETMTFAEIRHNRWYLLLKMGYSRAGLIGSRLSALLFSALYVYSLGFGLTVFLTFFLKYSMVTAYFPALYLAGLIDLLVMASLALCLSSLLKTTTYARALLILAWPVLYLLKNQTGFTGLLSNRVAMQDLYAVFSPEKSLYPLVAPAILLACLLIAGLAAWLTSRRYQLPSGRHGTSPCPDHTLVRINRRSGRKKLLPGPNRGIRRKKLLDTALSTLLVLFILAALLFNVAVLVINATAKGRHVSIRGVIPYVFKTSTMEPAIKMNDLAFFNRYGSGEEAQVGQIILFDEDQVMFVERIVEKREQAYIVDIDNYPPQPEYASMVKTVEQDQIVGIYSGRSRWLGALILFANTIFGRVLFLLIPAFLLFFQRSLAGWKPGGKTSGQTG